MSSTDIIDCYIYIKHTLNSRVVYNCWSLRSKEATYVSVFCEAYVFSVIKLKLFAPPRVNCYQIAADYHSFCFITLYTLWDIKTERYIASLLRGDRQLFTRCIIQIVIWYFKHLSLRSKNHILYSSRGLNIKLINPTFLYSREKQTSAMHTNVTFIY